MAAMWHGSVFMLVILLILSLRCNALVFPTRKTVLMPSSKYNFPHKFQKLQASVVSLDQSVVPRFVISKTTKVVITAAVFLVGVILSSLQEEEDDYYEDNSDAKSTPIKVSSKANKVAVDKASPSVFTEFINATQLLFNIILAKFSLLGENIRNGLLDIFDMSEEQAIDLKEWNICEFDKREELSDLYTRYRFRLPVDNAALPLGVGQELLMCSIDADSETKVVKESFFPISLPTAKGYFDILVSAAESSASYRFTKTLRALSKGDEIAFKGGGVRMRYDGDDDPITFMSFFASGLGISTALQVLRGVLPEGDSTIVDTELLWINEDLEDYVCDKEVEDMEYKFIEKCSVTRVVQRDLYHNDISKNKQVLNAIAGYEEGRVAVLCAPTYLLDKARQLYLEKGYPFENVVAIGL